MTDDSEQIKRVSKCVSKISPNDKTKLRYWRRRIFKPFYIHEGQKIQSPNFAIEIQHQGKRVRWSLGPANPEVAAAKARDLFLFLISNGWPATLAKYRPESATQADPSLGAFIDAVERTADLSPKTRVAYVNALRKIATDIFWLADDPRKFGGKRRKEWLERVHSIP